VDYIDSHARQVQCSRLPKGINKDLNPSEAIFEPEFSYQTNKVKLNTYALYEKSLNKDLASLEQDYNFK